MTILPHVLVGASIGSLMPNLPLAVIGGFASHFLVDFVPHWDPQVSRETSRKRKMVFLGLFLAELAVSGFVLNLFSYDPLLFWPGIIAAVIDLDNPLHIFKKIGINMNPKFHNKTTPVRGLLNQVLVILLTGIFLYTQGYLKF